MLVLLDASQIRVRGSQPTLDLKPATDEAPDGGEKQWQFLDRNGWKNMIPEVNDELLRAVRRELPEGRVNVTHKWVSPKSGKAQETQYLVSLTALTQKNKERKSSGTERRIRPVSIKPVRG